MSSLLLQCLREGYQVGRPAMGLVTSFLYLYSNPTATLWFSLYFGFVFQLGANAGNDFMDWERDLAEKGREFSLSRGKAHCKNAAWGFYLFATAVALAIGLFLDPLFGAQYFLITEVAGQLAYNGIFLGFPVHTLSIVKSFGFPLDVIVAAWTYMPFAHLVAQKVWIPNLTIAAWGTTMLWAQLKDYHHEKSTQVNTTATCLGPTNTAIVICLAALVMVQQDPRFLPYGAYTLYRCYIYPDKGKGKMTVVMALNLVGIVFWDEQVPSQVKYPTFAIQFLAFVAYRSSGVWGKLRQKYYGLKGIVHRHRPYDPSVWQETSPNLLLWKVGSLTGRSASGAMGLFSTEFARLCLMGFIIFRVQDTWADVCLDSKDRIEGLRRLPKRLKRLVSKADGNDSDGESNYSVDSFNSFTSNKSNDNRIRWDFDSRPRNRMYVDITLNLHRFDPVFLALPPHHKDILLQYAIELSEGWIELEQRKNEPVTPEIMRKHAEVALDAGFFGMCKGANPKLIAAIDPHSKSRDEKASASYIAFSDGLWFMNLAATIEEDVKEGVTLDKELQAMKGAVDQAVVRRVRVKWLIETLKCMGRSTAFLHCEHLVDSWSLRFFILFFLNVTVNECEKWLREYQGTKMAKKSGGKQIVRSLVQSLYTSNYSQGVLVSLKKAENLSLELQKLER